MRLMHVITNMMGSGGAEEMLSRLVRAGGKDRVLIVPLMDVSDRHLHLATKEAVEIRSMKARSAFAMMRAVFTLSGIIREERPEAIVCWLYHAMIVGQLAAQRSRLGIPVFWNVRQSLDDPRSLSSSTRLALVLTRSLSRRPTGIIFNSSRGLQLHQGFGFRNGNCVVIPNGFNPSVSETHLSRTPMRLGIAGRLHPQKDHPTFFAAAAEVSRARPAVRFVAAGAGMSPDNPTVRAMIQSAGLPPDAIELRGNVADMSAFYRDIDGLVLSSRTEGFPNVVAEAMGNGKPVIATDVGDTAALVGNTGFVVPAGDSSALARAMLAFFDLPPADYAALSAVAKRRIEDNYSIGRIAGLYEDFLAPRSSKAPAGSMKTTANAAGAPQY